MTALVVMLALLQAAVFVLSFTLPRDPQVIWWLYAPSVAVAWIAYVVYEAAYVPAYCTGECNLRVDLLLIYPYLAFVTICAIAYGARRRRER